MKLAFIFDTCFLKYKNHFFSINFTEEVWNRYLAVFDEIKVIGWYRNANENEIKNKVISDFEKVHFECMKKVSPIFELVGLAYKKNFIKRAIKGCDAVICRGTLGITECKELNKPYMIESVICPWDVYWNHSLLGKLFAIIAYLHTRFAIYNAHRVLYITQQFLQRRYPTKGENVAISDVSLQNIDYRILDKRINHINKIGKRRIRIGTAAAINVKYKGQEYVIRALSILKKQGINNFEYQLVGSGNKDRLECLAKKLDVLEEVVFLGEIKHENIFDWYDDIDIYIQPSIAEALGRSIIEAMSRGLLCIGNKVGGIPELIEEKYLYDNTNKKKEEAIAQLLKNIKIDDLKKSCEINFNKSFEFEKQVLDRKRKYFLEKFRDSITKR